MNNKKTILITGATDGLGKGLSFSLAKKGHDLILHGRNAEKGRKIIEDVKKQTGNSSIRYYNSDFSSMQDINNLCDELLEKETKIDVLINNAGLGVERSRRESKDGIEMLFQVDYLSNYIIINKLQPLLQTSGEGRIINIASAGQAPIDFSDVMLTKEWSGNQSYCQAKLAQIMLVFEYAEELMSKGITINAVHPASMMATKIVTHMFSPMSEVEDGIDSVEYLALDESLRNITGEYFFEKRKSRADSQAYDKEVREKLMKLSKELTGI